MNKDLKDYIEMNIFPQYEKYYSHGMIHIKHVIDNCLMFANHYDLNKDMLYTIGAYHDIGLNIDRKNHEIESAKILKNDDKLKKFFTSEQITIMVEAIEDHRGSKKERPRNIYGEVLSDSDRDFDIEILARRQLATSIKNKPMVKSFDEHFELCYKYILNRINSEGHFNLWTNSPVLTKKREKFESDFFNKDYAREIYRREYERILANGIIDKILNYYLDY